MEQNGDSNGQDATPADSQAAGTGVTKGPSPRKRRKVNHGMSTVPAPFVCILRGPWLIIKRVPAACVYCRRSVSHQWDCFIPGAALGGCAYA